MEYKIALCRILKRFNILRCDETKVPCPTKKNGVNGPSEEFTLCWRNESNLAKIGFILYASKMRSIRFCVKENMSP